MQAGALPKDPPRWAMAIMMKMCRVKRVIGDAEERREERNALEGSER